MGKEVGIHKIYLCEVLILQIVGNQWPCPRGWMGHPGRVWQEMAGSWHSRAEGTWESWFLD